MSWGVSASHVPVLTLIPTFSSIKKVLEIGSGNLSTPLFLDKTIYPDLKELVSVEQDTAWYDKVKGLFGEDSRLSLIRTIPASLYTYDLIFVDGPQDWEKRAGTIRYVMKELIKPLIIIHDIEVRAYKKQVNKDFHEFKFTFVKSPMTAVYSRDNLPLPILSKSNSIMKKHFNKVEEDWKRWKEVL